MPGGRRLPKSCLEMCGGDEVDERATVWGLLAAENTIGAHELRLGPGSAHSGPGVSARTCLRRPGRVPRRRCHAA